jgi:Ca-activated chloride channel homolog
MKVMLIGSFLFCITVLHSQSSGHLDKPTDPKYPGGPEALYDYISQNLVYPVEARQKGIEGNVFLQFVVNESGYIDPETVEVIKGIDPSCDSEAVRVIKSSKVQWQPSLQGNKSVSSKYKLAIIFKLTNPDFPNPYKSFDIPLKAIITKKPSQQTSLDWVVYEDMAMNQKNGKISPGDSVVTYGWGPYVLWVRNAKVNGFVPYRAVKFLHGLDSLSKMVETQSSIIIAQQARADSIIKANELAKWVHLLELAKQSKAIDHPLLELAKKELAFFHISTSKKNLMVSECTTIDIQFFISYENKIPYQWHDLGPQISNIILNQVPKENCFIADNQILNIDAVDQQIGDNYFVSFKLWSAAFCPTEVKDLHIPSLALTMEKKIREPTPGKLREFIEFKSAPLTVKVKPKPQQVTVTSTDFFSLIGNFKITEEFKVKKVGIQEPLEYSLTLEGVGLTYPVPPPKINGANFKGHFVNRLHMDTIINNVYLSRLTFNYSITFNKPNEQSLGNLILFSAINPATGATYNLTSKVTVFVDPQRGDVQLQQALELPRNNFILVDISQSMMIEDYEPNRLGFVKRGLSDFLLTLNTCNYNFILISAEPTDLKSNGVESDCSQQNIDKIDFSLQRGRGTAIGDAIWYAAHPLQGNSRFRKMIILSDGESTAGIISTTIAAKLAIRRNVKIFTIGIGHPGQVKFGTYLTGQPVLIENTFSDSDLKRLALQTGGKYYWANNEQELAKALKEISLIP